MLYPDKSDLVSKAEDERLLKVDMEVEECKNKVEIASHKSNPLNAKFLKDKKLSLIALGVFIGVILIALFAH